MTHWATKKLDIRKLSFSCLVTAIAVLSGCGGASSGSEFQQFSIQSNCVTADQFYIDYQNNEVAAQQKYKGNVNRICGIVDGIELNLLNNPVISLHASLFGVVNIGGVDTESAANISKGSFAVFECSEINELLGTPVLTECTIVPGRNIPNEAQSDSKQTIQNEPSADIDVGEAQPTSSGRELWKCDFGDPEGTYSVTLTATSYQFAPYNPDGGALSGALEMLEEERRNGTIVTSLEFVGSGAPPGRWEFVQGPGKRKALLTYAVESSGDGGECTPPGGQPQYIFN